MPKRSLKNILVLFLLIFSVQAHAFRSDVGILNDSGYFKKIYSLLSGAQESIYVIMYSATFYEKYSDSPSNLLIQSLVSAAKRGVSVNVLLDQNDWTDASNSKENKKVAGILEKGGVKVFLDRKNITTHAKLVIVDDRFVVIGSTNWTYHALTDNNETNVVIDSKETAEEYIKYFEELKSLCK